MSEGEQKGQISESIWERAKGYFKKTKPSLERSVEIKPPTLSKESAVLGSLEDRVVSADEFQALIRENNFTHIRRGTYNSQEKGFVPLR